VCVCAQNNKKTKKPFGAVWLRTLTNVEVPFGAGACRTYATLLGVESTVQR
jgi:hypothetical protein